MGDRRVCGRLGPRLRLLAVPIDIIIATTEVEGTKLDGGTVDLAISGHADGFFLVQHASLMGGGADCALSCGLDRRGSIAGAWCLALCLVLLLGSREGGGGGTLSRVPRIVSCACGGIASGWFGIVNNLLEIRLGEFIVGGRERDFGFDYGGRSGGSGGSGRSGLFENRCGLLFRSGRFRLWLGFGGVGFGGSRLGFGGFRWSRSRRLLTLGDGRLGDGRLPQHACPGLGLGGWRLRGLSGSLGGGGIGPEVLVCPCGRFLSRHRERLVLLGSRAIGRSLGGTTTTTAASVGSPIAPSTAAL
jgi:hypothetical protein